MSDRAKAKAVLLEAALAAGREGIQRTNHYKVFWLAHLFHMLSAGTLLTQWSIVKMPQGPGVDQGQALLDELEAEAMLVVGQRAKGPYLSMPASVPRERLERAEAVVREHLSPQERESIHEALACVGPDDASTASRWSHKVSRSWKAAELGQTLDIFADLYVDDIEFSELTSRVEADSETAARILGEA